MSLAHLYDPPSKRTKQREEEIKSLQEEVEKLKRSECDLREQIDKLKTKNKHLKTKTKEMEEKLDREEPYEKIFNERKDLQERDKTNSSQIKQLESENENQKSEIEELQQTLQSTKDELKQAKDEYETEKRKSDEVFQAREDLDSRIDELEKEKCELEDELVKLKNDILKKTEEDEEKAQLAEQLSEQKQREEDAAKAYLEEVRKELGEYRSKVEGMHLESEALKSENESLFRANEAKKKDMDEILGELTSIRNELKIEQQRFVKLKQEWDEEKKRTEFVIVSKSAGTTKQKPTPRPKDDDSEDEHLVSVTEAARAEAEALRENERVLRKRINQLQIDKEELFRSGTNLFSENKSLKNKYDDVCNERSKLLQSESKLQHKLREKEKEIKDLKKTVDDLYYQNLAIKSNDENESKQNAYVVLMGNEMVKQLEKEKSALNRRVKFLEQENRDRVIELEKQSSSLIEYSKKYDKHTTFPPVKGPFNIDSSENRTTRYRPTSKERERTYARDHSREPDRYSSGLAERKSNSDRYRTERPWSNKRSKDDEVSQHATYRVPSQNQGPRDNSRNDMRPQASRIHSPDYYRDTAALFAQRPSRQPSFAPSNQSNSSRFSLPPMPNHFDGHRPDTITGKTTSRRTTPFIN